MPRKHTILTVLLLSGASALASPEARKPPPDEQVPKQLIGLRTQLFKAGRAAARAAIGRFRALCGQDGYPLVSNVAGKSGMYQPSELWRDVRQAERKGTGR